MQTPMETSMELTNANELIAKIQSCECGGDIYSKEQVLHILRQVKCTVVPQNELTIAPNCWEKISEYLSEIRNCFDNLEVDTDNIEFSIRHGNEIYVDSGDIEITEKDELENAISNLEDFISKIEETEEI